MFNSFKFYATIYCKILNDTTINKLALKASNIDYPVRRTRYVAGMSFYFNSAWKLIKCFQTK